jgi:putative ABC transport system permease protein
MKLVNLVRIAVRALQRNKLRAFLTMLGIIIGVAAVITMMSIGQGSSKSIQSSLSNMGANLVTITPFNNVPGVRLAASSVQSLTMKDVTALQQQAVHLSAISPTAQANGQAIKGAMNWPTNIQGVAPSFLDIRKFALQDGIMFSDDDVRASAKVCLLGQTVITNLFANGENPIGQTIRFNKIPFQVIGTLSPKGQNTFGQDQDDIIIAPYTTVQNRLTASVYFQNLNASAASENESDAASAEVTKILRTTHKIRPGEEDDFSVRTQADLISTLNSTSSMLTTLLTVIASISLLIGGIGIMNIMYVSVTERTKEIGLRMSIGAKGVDILMQFLIEAIMISITGGIIGVVLGVTASLVVASTLHWPTLISQTSIVVSFIVCVVTGVFFGYYPAQKASRLDPIDALRYE